MNPWGCQDVCNPLTDYGEMARAFGYSKTFAAEDGREFESGLRLLRESEGPALLEVKTCTGSLANLGRPAESPAERKHRLMKALNSCKK